MGLKYEQDNFSEAKDTNVSYYYSKSQIHEMIKKHPQFEKYASNKNLWIKHVIKEKVLKIYPYKKEENAHFIDMNENNSSEEFYK